MVLPKSLRKYRGCRAERLKNCILVTVAQTYETIHFLCSPLELGVLSIAMKSGLTDTERIGIEPSASGNNL